MTSSYQTRMEDDTYNGWTNCETWNVALWLGNDEGLYEMARNWRHHGYTSLVHMLIQMKPATPDGVKWDDAALNIIDLNDMMAQL